MARNALKGFIVTAAPRCRRTILRISGITSVYDETSKVGEAQTAYEEFTGTHEEVRLWFLRYAAEQAAKRVSETASV